MDVPNVLYVYWKHAVTFRDIPKVTKSITTSKLSISSRDDDSSDSDEKSVHE